MSSPRISYVAHRATATDASIVHGRVRYFVDHLGIGQADPPSKRIFHEPSGCLTHVEVKVPICIPASSKTGPLENPRSPAAFVTTRSGCQRKGATAGLKNSDQLAITSCLPRIILRCP